MSIGEEFTGTILPETLKRLAESGQPLHFIVRPVKKEADGKLRVGFEELTVLPNTRHIIEVAKRPVPPDKSVHPVELLASRQAKGRRTGKVLRMMLNRARGVTQ